jgi:hypothetical protein
MVVDDQPSLLAEYKISSLEEAQVSKQGNNHQRMRSNGSDE